MDVVNVLGDEWDEFPGARPPGFDWRYLAVGRRLGGELLGASVYELEPGQRSFPYHWHAGNEELLVVLRGRPTLRAPGGERELEPGELVVFRRGPDGAHQLRNDSDEPARVLILSTRVVPEIVEYPDSGKIGVASMHGRRILRAEEADYWEGES